MQYMFIPPKPSRYREATVRNKELLQAISPGTSVSLPRHVPFQALFRTGLFVPVRTRMSV